MEQTPADHASPSPEPSQQQRLEKMFAQLSHSHPDVLEQQLLTMTQAKGPPAKEAPGGHQFVANIPKRTATTTFEAGSLCGPFRIIERLGEGGMGTVYLAGRDDLPDLRVALKTVSTWSPRLHARFERECRILSALNHPGIAQLIDAGALSNGQPWFAMEYVEGETLDGYLAKNKPGLSEMLAVFLKICEAISHAHQHMVIHRDLKPSNIMIQPNGDPKLLDFGIAATLDPDTGRQATVTGFTEMILTPQYASPEQANGQRLSASSDVYSLGIVLYEMLTGEPPYRFDAPGPLEMMRVINEAPIIRPSKIRAQTGKRSGPFTQQLRGDLDTIILKALERHIQRRYASVEMLAADVRRYLNRQPIAARPASFGYLCQKFLMRHRRSVGAAAGLFVGLLLFSLYAQHQNHLLTQQRDLAERRLQTSEQVTQFMVSLFEHVDPDLAKNREVSAFEILEGGRLQITRNLQEHPEIQSLVLKSLGRVYRSLGHYDVSRELFSQAIDQQDREATWPASFELIQTLQMAGDLNEAEQELARLEASDWTEAKPLDRARLSHARGNMWFSRGQLRQAKEAYSLAAKRLSELPNEEQSKLLNNLATLETELGHFDQAIQQQKQLLGLRRNLYGRQHSKVAEALAELSRLYLKLDELDQAETYMNESEGIYRDLFGDHHPLIVKCLLRRGILARVRSNFEKADTLLGQAFTLATQQLGDNHPLSAAVLKQRAIASYEQGKFELGEKQIRQVLTVQKQALGENHPEVASTMDSLAYYLQKQGKVAAAKPLLQQAIAMKQETLGEAHPVTAETIEALAMIFQDERNFEKAEQLLRQALQIKIGALGEKHRSIAFLYNNLAGLLHDRGKYKEAEKLYQLTLTNLIKNLGDLHPYVAGTYNNLAALLQAQGNHAGAVGYYRKALALWREKHGEDHPRIPLALNNLARTLYFLCDYAEAEALFREAIAKSTQISGARDSRTAFPLGNLAMLLTEIGDYQEAGSLLKQTLSIQREANGPSHFRTLKTQAMLADLDKRLGHLDQAQDAYRAILETVASLPAANRWNPENERLALTEILLLQNRLREAEQVLQKVWSTLKEENDPTPSTQLQVVQALLYRKQGDFTQARPLLEEALQARSAYYGGPHPRVAAAQIELATLLVGSGKAEAALPILEQAAATLSKMPEGHESHQVVQSLKGLVLRQMGNEEEGRSLVSQAHQRLVQRLGETHYLTQAAAQRLE